MRRTQKTQNRDFSCHVTYRVTKSKDQCWDLRALCVCNTLRISMINRRWSYWQITKTFQTVTSLAIPRSKNFLAGLVTKAPRWTGNGLGRQIHRDQIIKYASAFETTNIIFHFIMPKPVNCCVPGCFNNYRKAFSTCYRYIYMRVQVQNL